MKRICWALCLLLCCCAVRAQIKVVEKPWFIPSYGNLEISKVSLYEKRTVLEAVYYGSAGEEVKLDSVVVLLADGHEYRLRSAKGISQMQFQALPADGILKFRMTFDPLPAGTSSFDFVEKTVGGWTVLNVRLDGMRQDVMIPERLQSQTLDYDCPLPLPEPRFGKFRITGRFLGGIPESIRYNAVTGRAVLLLCFPSCWKTVPLSLKDMQ